MLRSAIWQSTCLSCVVLVQGVFAQAPATKEAPAKQAKEAAAKEPIVELLEPGKAPLKQLRFAPKEGSKMTKVMNMKMSQNMTMAGQKMPSVDIPGQKMFIEIEVKKVASSGDIDFEYSYADIQLDEDSEKPSAVGAQMMPILKQLIGTTGTGTISNRGLAKKADIKLKDGLDPTVKSVIDGMKDSFSQLSSPVPEEAVGVGGKWKTTQNISANGMVIKQTSINEVVSMDSSGFTLKITLEQTADKQELKNPMLPPGAVMKLESLESSGEGKSQVLFADIFPKTASSSVTSNTKIAFSIAGQNQAMKMDMEMEMTLGDPDPKK